MLEKIGKRPPKNGSLKVEEHKDFGIKFEICFGYNQITHNLYRQIYKLTNEPHLILPK